ncbi:MAG: protein kinase, partial [Gemmataceae bacterium]|nr:protein kinase [Gemmataceae bacterium]
MSTDRPSDPGHDPAHTLPFQPATGETLASSADDVPAAPDIPGFSIEGVLGRGGVGVVYRALDQRLGRTVALKMLLAGGWATPEDRRRFRTEAEALAHVKHPGIVQVHASGEHEGRPWLCLEFCPGGSLAPRLRAPMQPREAALLVEKLARAVHHAHQAGIVHRDLKPGNVLFGEDGQPRVGDFGLARRLEDTLHTGTGSILGTPAYMAPEQARGDVRSISPATDVWALGIILYECLAGRPPFRSADAFDTVLQVIRGEPVPPSRLQARLPADIETIVLKCLEKEPTRRYASAADLADDLAAFAEGRPIKARPVGWTERAAKWARRHPAIAALVAACATLFLVGFALVTWGFLAARAARDDAREAAKRATEQLDRAEEALYRNAIALAERELSAHGFPRARQVLAGLDRERRGWEHGYLSWLAAGGLRTWRLHDGRVMALALHKGTAATGGMDGSIRLFDTAGESAPRTRAEKLPPVLGLAFSADGKRLAAACQDGKLRVYEPEGSKPPLVIAAHDKAAGDAAFQPGGALLASCGEDGTIAFWDAATGKARGRLAAHDNTVSRLVFDPKGERLASACYDGTAIVWDVKTRKPLMRHRHRAALLGIDFSPDGLSLAISDTRGVLKVLDAKTGKVERSIAAHRNLAGSVRFSPDGTELVSAGHDRSIRVWDVETGRERLQLEGHDVAVQAVLHDGSARLLSVGGDGTAKRWDARHPPTSLVVHEGANEVRDAAYIGAACASLAGDGEVRLIDPASGKLLDTRSLASVLVLGPLGRMAASAEGDIAVSSHNERSVWYWPRGEEKPRRLARHKCSITALAWSGGLLASLSADGEAQVWDLAAGKQAAAWRCHEDEPTACVFHGEALLTAGKEGKVIRWRARTGEKLAEREIRADALAASAGGDRLAACGPGGVHLLSPSLEGETALLPGAARAAAWSPEGKRLVVAGADGVLR